MYPSRSGKNVAANFENNKHKSIFLEGVKVKLGY